MPVAAPTLVASSHMPITRFTGMLAGHSAAHLEQHARGREGGGGGAAAVAVWVEAGPGQRRGACFEAINYVGRVVGQIPRTGRKPGFG